MWWHSNAFHLSRKKHGCSAAAFFLHDIKNLFLGMGNKFKFIWNMHDVFQSFDDWNYFSRTIAVKHSIYCLRLQQTLFIEMERRNKSNIIEIFIGGPFLAHSFILILVSIRIEILIEINKIDIRSIRFLWDWFFLCVAKTIIITRYLDRKDWITTIH